MPADKYPVYYKVFRAFDPEVVESLIRLDNSARFFRLDRNTSEWYKDDSGVNVYGFGGYYPAEEITTEEAEEFMADWRSQTT